MFNIETKTLVIAGAAALTAVAVGVVACMWSAEKKWDQEKANKVIDDLLEAYNEAVAQYPHDRNKASFIFETSAISKKIMFRETHGEFAEFEAWETKFDAQVKHFKAALRKA